MALNRSFPLTAAAAGFAVVGRIPRPISPNHLPDPFPPTSVPAFTIPGSLRLTVQAYSFRSTMLSYAI